MYGGRVVFSPRWWNRSSRPLSMLRNILQITLTVMTISKWRENVCVRECETERERERRGMTSRRVTSELSSIRFHSLSLSLSVCTIYIYNLKITDYVLRPNPPLSSYASLSPLARNARNICVAIIRCTVCSKSVERQRLIDRPSYSLVDRLKRSPPRGGPGGG